MNILAFSLRTLTKLGSFLSCSIPIAPLISTGSLAHPDVDFIGLDVRDNPTDASKFIAEFLSDADMTHLEDRSGNIPVQLGATRGVPITFFYRANGEQAGMHLGIIDEPTLARFLDEIDR